MNKIILWTSLFIFNPFSFQEQKYNNTPLKITDTDFFVIKTSTLSENCYDILVQIRETTFNNKKDYSIIFLKKPCASMIQPVNKKDIAELNKRTKIGYLDYSEIDIINEVWFKKRIITFNLPVLSYDTSFKNFIATDNFSIGCIIKNYREFWFIKFKNEGLFFININDFQRMLEMAIAEIDALKERKYYE